MTALLTKVISSKLSLKLLEIFSEKGALVITLLGSQIVTAFCVYTLYCKINTTELYIRENMLPALERSTLALERSNTVIELFTKTQKKD